MPDPIRTEEFGSRGVARKAFRKAPFSMEPAADIESYDAVPWLRTAWFALFPLSSGSSRSCSSSRRPATCTSRPTESRPFRELPPSAAHSTPVSDTVTLCDGCQCTIVPFCAGCWKGC